MGTFGWSCGLKCRLEAYANSIRSIYGIDLVSIILYGSAASEEAAGKNSNINILVVLRDTGLKSLEKSVPLVKPFKYRFFKPVFFTEDYMKRTLDVFPIEFLDIKENYKLLYGKDVVAGLTVDPKNLRFQCEQELKAKLINIKKTYPGLSRSSDLKELLLKSFTATLHITRNILRLKNLNAPYKKEDVLDIAGKALGLDAKLFNRILALKAGTIRVKSSELRDMLVRFTDELERLAEVADGL